MKRLITALLLMQACLANAVILPYPYSTGQYAPKKIDTPKQATNPNILDIPKPVYNTTPGIFIPKQALKTYMPSLNLSESLDHVTMANFSPKGMLGMLQHLMKVSNPIRQSLYEAQSASYEVQVSRAEYLPHLDADMDFGREKRRNPTPPNSIMNFDQEDVTLSQLIYDFGKTLATIDTAKVNYDIAKNNFQQTVQSELVSGITTYCQNIRDSKRLVYSIESAKRIHEQYKVEKIKYDRGAGLKTDLLEVQSQLTGAKARVITSKASLATSENNYLAVFHEVPGDFEHARYPTVPRNLIPDTMKEALTIAHHYNTSIKNAEYQLELANYQIKSARAEMLPSISGSLDYSRQYNVSGTAGTRRDYMGMLSLNYNLFNGGGDMAQLLANHKSRYAAIEQLRQAYLTTDQAIRNSWEEYSSASLSYKYFAKQVVELKQFLALAKRERLLGRRSILDVLLADVNVINAESEATTAQARMVIAAYTMLQQMGILDMKIIAKGRPGPAV